jgi:hypothetical protein
MKTHGFIELSVVCIRIKIFFLYDGCYTLCEIFLISILLGVFLYSGRKMSKTTSGTIYLRRDKTGYKFCSGPQITKGCNDISIMCHNSLT